MLISRQLCAAINDQIGHEFGASLQYVSIAAHFERKKLSILSKLFFDQSEEERKHAMKFVKYVLDTQGELKVPPVPAPAESFPTAEDAVQAALAWENQVTGQISNLMTMAVKENDYLAQSFLQWFVDEQLEEVVKMDRLLGFLGILFGILGGNLLALEMSVPSVIPWDWVAIGVLVCSCVGIGFGTYPAWKAANMDPIDALRYE